MRKGKKSKAATKSGEDAVVSGGKSSKPSRKGNLKSKEPRALRRKLASPRTPIGRLPTASGSPGASTPRSAHDTRGPLYSHLVTTPSQVPPLNASSWVLTGVGANSVSESGSHPDVESQLVTSGEQSLLTLYNSAIKGGSGNILKTADQYLQSPRASSPISPKTYSFSVSAAMRSKRASSPATSPRKHVDLSSGLSSRKAFTPQPPSSRRQMWGQPMLRRLSSAVSSFYLPLHTALSQKSTDWTPRPRSECTVRSRPQSARSTTSTLQRSPSRTLRKAPAAEENFALIGEKIDTPRRQEHRTRLEHGGGDDDASFSFSSDSEESFRSPRKRSAEAIARPLSAPAWRSKDKQQGNPAAGRNTSLGTLRSSLELEFAKSSQSLTLNGMATHKHTQQRPVRPLSARSVNWSKPQTHASSPRRPMSARPASARTRTSNSQQHVMQRPRTALGGPSRRRDYDLSDSDEDRYVHDEKEILQLGSPRPTSRQRVVSSTPPVPSGRQSASSSKMTSRNTSPRKSPPKVRSSKERISAAEIQRTQNQLLASVLTEEAQPSNEPVELEVHGLSSQITPRVLRSPRKDRTGETRASHSPEHAPSLRTRPLSSLQRNHVVDRGRPVSAPARGAALSSTGGQQLDNDVARSMTSVQPQPRRAIPDGINVKATRKLLQSVITKFSHEGEAFSPSSSGSRVFFSPRSSRPSSASMYFGLSRSFFAKPQVDRFFSLQNLCVTGEKKGPAHK